MDTKVFWRSKGFWSGVLSIVTGIGLLVQGDTIAGLATLVGGVGAIVGRAQATQPLGLRTTSGGSDEPTSGTWDPLH